MMQDPVGDLLDLRDGAARWGDSVTVVAGILAFYLAFKSFPAVSRRLSQMRLAWTRWRSLRQAFRRGRPTPLSAPGLLDQLRRSGLRFTGVELSPAWEIDWLSKRLGLEHSLTFSPDVSADLLFELALGYRRLGARLRTRSLLGSSQPMLDLEADLSHGIYVQLMKHANLIDQRPAVLPTADSFDDGLQSGTADSLIRLPTADRGRRRGELLLTVSWLRSRLVTRGSDARKRIAAEDEHGVDEVAVAVHAGRRDTVEAFLAKPHSYDGVLPRLLGWREEKDKGNGAPILHVSIAETTYLAHTVVSDPAAAETAHDPRSNCLTLSLLLVTSDDRLVAVRRHADDSYYPGCWAPTVNGNLDIPVAGRKDADRDELGLPDITAALCREAREEIGIVIDPAQVAVDGIAQISTSTERGTYVLCATAFVQETYRDIASGARYADRVLGAWELDGPALAIGRPRTAEDATAVLRWIWRRPDVMPHLVAGVTLFLANAGLIPVEEWGTWTLGPADEPPPLQPFTLLK